MFEEEEEQEQRVGARTKMGERKQPVNFTWVKVVRVRISLLMVLFVERFVNGLVNCNAVFGLCFRLCYVILFLGFDNLNPTPLSLCLLL